MAEGIRHPAKDLAIQAALWFDVKASCFCSPRRSSSLLMQCVRLPPGEPAMQRMSATSLGSELPGEKNISGRTEAVIAPCPGGGDAKSAARFSLSLASLSFHSVQCFRLLGLLVLSDLPNITTAFTGFKYFQVFTTTSPPRGDLQTALLAVLSLAGSLEFQNLCALKINEPWLDKNRNTVTSHLGDSTPRISQGLREI